jgi:hypothetical protein
VKRETLKLTSASITPHIQTLVRQGALVAFEPVLDPDQGHCRCIWMHPQVAKWVGRPGLGTSGNDYYASIREFLKGFVIGEDFDDDTMLFPLDPKVEAIFSLSPRLEFWADLSRRVSSSPRTTKNVSFWRCKVSRESVNAAGRFGGGYFRTIPALQT